MIYLLYLFITTSLPFVRISSGLGLGFTAGWLKAATRSFEGCANKANAAGGLETGTSLRCHQ